MSEERQKFIDAYVADKARAWERTNNLPHTHHPPRNRQAPSPQHLATWRDMAAQQPDCPKDGAS